MFATGQRAKFAVDEGKRISRREIVGVVADRGEFTYWLPPSAVKQSGKTKIARPHLLLANQSAARSGTLSPNGLQLVWRKGPSR